MSCKRPLTLRQRASPISAVASQRRSFDLGYFNKRVDTFHIDNGAYHNQATINPFSVSNVFANYTLRTNGRLNGTKLRLGLNNLRNDHNITGEPIKG